jgi:hypothetical protein
MFNARPMSSNTVESNSSSTRSESAANAIGEPTLPSPHAACARTRVDSSVSPTRRTGTASSAPQRDTDIPQKASALGPFDGRLSEKRSKAPLIGSEESLRQLDQLRTVEPFAN